MPKRKLDNIQYCTKQYLQPNNKKKRTTRSNLQQIKLIMNDPSFHEYSIDDLGQLSRELKDVIDKLQIHKTHIDSILNMYL